MTAHDNIRYLKVSVIESIIFKCANILQNSDNLLNFPPNLNQQ